MHVKGKVCVVTGAASGIGEAIARAYADVIDRGEWFAPVRTALNSQVESHQESVSGTIRLQFFNGDCEIVEKRALEGRPPLKIAATKG